MGFPIPVTKYVYIESQAFISTTWRRHQMETFSASLAPCGNSPVYGEFPVQRPVTRSFDVFFDLRLIKRLSKHSRGWWFETLSRPLRRHCNDSERAPAWLMTSQWQISLNKTRPPPTSTSTWAAKWTHFARLKYRRVSYRHHVYSLCQLVFIIWAFLFAWEENIPTPIHCHGRVLLSPFEISGFVE